MNISNLSFFGSFNRILNVNKWTFVHSSYISINIGNLSAELPIKRIFWFMSLEENITVPSNFLSCCHWVWIFFLWDVCQNFKFLFQSIHAFFVFFLFFWFLVYLVLACWFVCNHIQIFWIEVKVFVQYSTSIFLSYCLIPLGINFNLVHVFSWSPFSSFWFWCHLLFYL